MGQLFSQSYLEHVRPTSDSERMRSRIGAFIRDSRFVICYGQIVEKIHRELGVNVRSKGPSYNQADLGFDLEEFFVSGEITRILDAITIIWRVFPDYSKNEWRDFIDRVFTEENVGYRIDGEGIVRYFVDQEFERNRSSSLRCLDDPKFNAVAAEFENAFRKLSDQPPDTKSAVRAIFEAVEILVKWIVDGGKVTRLGPAEVDKYLKPLAGQVYNENKVALDSANQVLNSLSDWINANQMYRHGQKVEEPAPPPLELAVVIVSAGASFLRWLVELDSRKVK